MLDNTRIRATRIDTTRVQVSSKPIMGQPISSIRFPRYVSPVNYPNLRANARWYNRELLLLAKGKCLRCGEVMPLSIRQTLADAGYTSPNDLHERPDVCPFGVCFLRFAKCE